MKKLSSRIVFAVTILGMLMILTISGGIYVSGPTNQSLQNLEDSPVTLHTKADNYALQWSITWGGAGSDIGYGVAVDANGSIYCTGLTSFGAGLALFKFAPNGTRLWNLTWSGASYGYGYGKQVAVDASGAIYCTGVTYPGAGNGDLALVKFAPNSTRLWNRTWGGVYADYGYGVTVDASGSILCTGATYYGFGAEDDPDLALVKFAPNGTQLWSTTWGGSYAEAGQDVAVDANGSIYCTGSTVSFSQLGGTEEQDDIDLALVKFAPNGTRLWNITWNEKWSDIGYGVAVDANGFIYCHGDGSGQPVLLKYTPNGAPSSLGMSGNTGGYGVAADAGGSIYCCGTTGTDMVLVKLAPNGTRLWNLTWGGAWHEVCYGVAVDASGSIYCIGGNNISTSTSDMVLYKFSTVSTSDGIPGFEFAVLLIGVLALLGLGYRRRLDRTTS